MNIREKVYELVMPRTKMLEAGSDIKDETDLVYDLGLDSLSLVELLVDLESEFDMEIDEENMDFIYKFGTLVDYITQNHNK